MRVTLKIELEFDSWFEDDRQPNTKEEWSDFFNNYLMPEWSILGVEDEEFQDMIALNSYNIECVDVS